MKVLGGRYLTEADLAREGINKLGSNVRVHETAILVDLERIEIGSNVRIDPYCVLSAAGGYLKIGRFRQFVARGAYLFRERRLYGRKPHQPDDPPTSFARPVRVSDARTPRDRRLGQRHSSAAYDWRRLRHRGAFACNPQFAGLGHLRRCPGSATTSEKPPAAEG
jgi:hypothetical protein